MLIAIGVGVWGLRAEEGATLKPGAGEGRSAGETGTGGLSWLAVPAEAEACVQEALTSNLALGRRAIDVEQARARLDEVRSAYQPRVDLVARYSLADGGRTIDFPTGDLLNNVYATLNDYLVSQGKAAAFPTIGNQSIPLLRAHEQETKLRLTQPLYHPAISRGTRAQSAALAGEEASLAAYRRELRYTVLAAYYRYAQAEAAVRIYGSASEVTAEALRVDRMLHDNGQLTEDRVLRAEADDLTVRGQRADALRDANTARAWVNFLLNRPLDAKVETADTDELARLTDRMERAASPAGIGAERREELVAIDRAAAAAEASEGVARAGRLPTVALQVEGGIQGENYRTGSGADFVQGSVVAELNLWDGRERASQVRQARLARRAVELQRDELARRLAFELQQARDEWTAALDGFRAAERRAEASARAFKLVAEQQREGLVAQLGFLDARNEATRAELGREVARARLLTAAAALDRAAALTPIKTL